MKWIKPRKEIILSCHYSYLNRYPILSQNKKQDIKKKCKNTCSYCGGMYKYYRYIEEDTVCPFCYMILNLNDMDNDKLILCYSKLSQLDIIRMTTKYIFDNDKIPYPQIIDPNIQLIPLSIMELSCALMDNKLPNIFDNYKIFINHNFNIGYIKSVVFDNSIFCEDSEISEYVYDEYKMSKKERKYLKSILNVKKINFQIVDEIENKIFDICKYTKEDIIVL